MKIHYSRNGRGAAQMKLGPAVAEAQSPDCTAPLTHSLSVWVLSSRRGSCILTWRWYLFLGGVIIAVPILLAFCGISKQLIVFWQRSCDQITVLIICKGNIVVDDVLTSAVCSDRIPLNCKSQVTLQMGKVLAVAYQECREKKYVMVKLGVIMQD